MIRRAALSDLDQVAALIHGSFDPALLSYLVYAQHGIGRFLADFIGDDNTTGRTMLVAVGNQGEVKAFAEFRRLGPGEAHLSYICVAPEARGQGLASALIHEFLTGASVTSLHLDVFAENRPALALYRKLGFRQTGETSWFARPLPPPGRRATSLTIIDRAASDAAFDRHGFCELQMDWRDDTRRVGRIGENVVRCFAPEDFADNDLLSGLHQLFPTTREALLIGSGDPLGGIHLINRSLRLTGTF